MVQRAVPLEELPVDEHLLRNKSPFELIDGRLIPVSPVEEPHSQAHADLVALLMAHAAPGYRVSLDMLTRVAVDSEVAPDASVYPVARDAGGHRQLEVLAFEVLATERRKHAARKAQLLVARGVRRVFAIDLRWSQVLEWDRALDDWRLLPPGSVIDDPCFVRPLPTSALRGVGASDEMMEGWVTQGHPVLRREVERARAEVQHEVDRVRGEAQREVERIQAEAERAREGLRESLVDLCEAYGVELTEERRAHLAELDLTGLEALRARLRRDRAWPQP